MASEPTTVTITGGGGQIGYALMFRIAAGDMLGPDRPVRLRLLEIPQGMRAAEGAALELQDCAFPLLVDVDVTDDPLTAFNGARIAMLVGARPRTAGMERGDLLAANAGIFGPQGKAIGAVADEDVRVVVVGNPRTRTRSSPRHPLLPTFPPTASARSHASTTTAPSASSPRRCRSVRATSPTSRSGATTRPRSSPTSRTPTSPTGRRCSMRSRTGWAAARRRRRGSTTSSSPGSPSAAPRSSRCAARRRWHRRRTRRSSMCATSSSARAGAGRLRRSSRAANTACPKGWCARSRWSRAATAQGYRVVEGLDPRRTRTAPARGIRRGTRRRARRGAGARRAVARQ